VLKIDLHTHILPENWPNLQEKYGYGGWVQLDHHKPCCARMMIDGAFFREVQANVWDPGVRMADMTRTMGPASVQVLSTVPVMFSYWAKPRDALDLSRLLNDHIADLVRTFPNRFAGLGTVPLQAPHLAIRELERCVRELGLAGVQIGSHVERPGLNGEPNGKDWNLSEPALAEFFAAAAELGAAVFVHPWDMMGKGNMDKYWLPWLVGMPAETARAICSVIFSGLLDKLPNLRIAFAHGGGSFPGTIGRIEHGCQVRPDLCSVDGCHNPRDYLAKLDSTGTSGGGVTTPARFYVDSLTHDPDLLRHLIKLMGPQRIALGSDYPFPLGEDVPGHMIESMPDLNPDTKQQILSATAIDFLGAAGRIFSHASPSAPSEPRPSGSGSPACT
jgi:aminocarboxymuconate-semialdehyde decarboxylase